MESILIGVDALNKIGFLKFGVTMAMMNLPSILLVLIIRYRMDGNFIKRREVLNTFVKLDESISSLKDQMKEFGNSVSKLTENVARLDERTEGLKSIHR